MGVYAGHFDFGRPLLRTVPNLFSPSECAGILDGAADCEWLPATVNSADGRVVDVKVRSSTTAVLRDERLATELYRRVRAHVPARMSAEIAGVRAPMNVAGVNLPLRIYRYEPGQHFGLHQDQFYAGKGNTMSLLTLMDDLNDDFKEARRISPSGRERSCRRRGRRFYFSIWFCTQEIA